MAPAPAPAAAATLFAAPDPLVVRAYLVAFVAHMGAVDKVGHPYIGHPVRVAARVAAAGYDARHIAAALLHDVLEDTDWTVEDLLAAGIPAEVVEAVVALSKRKREPLVEAIARAGANPIARVVKAADVADNTDPDRVAQLEPDDADRLADKYDRTLAVLAAYDAPVFG